MTRSGRASVPPRGLLGGADPDEITAYALGADAAIGSSGLREELAGARRERDAIAEQLAAEHSVALGWRDERDRLLSETCRLTAALSSIAFRTEGYDPASAETTSTTSTSSPQARPGTRQPTRSAWGRSLVTGPAAAAMTARRAKRRGRRRADSRPCLRRRGMTPRAKASTTRGAGGRHLAAPAGQHRKHRHTANAAP